MGMNLDKIFAGVIHSPKIGDTPLYTRIDNVYEESKSEKWLKAAGRNFNSPNNIRRVFIGSSKVLVQFYKPPIRNGKASTNGNWLEVSLGEDLYETTKKFIGYNQEIRQYYMEKAINPKAIEPEKVKVQGLGLKVFSSPWVVSNIEEVYFDTSVLLSEDIRGAIPGAQAVFEGWVGGKLQGVINTNLGRDLFFTANGVSENDYRKRYPRLRTIGVVSNLESLFGGVDREFRDGIWMTSNIGVRLLKDSGASFIYNDLGKDLKNYNPAFHCRDGIYVYDRDILVEYIERYKNKASQGTSEKKQEVVEVRTKKSAFEVHLDKIRELRGDAYVLKALIIGLNGVEKSEIEEIFRAMSSEGEVMYRKLLKGE